MGSFNDLRRWGRCRWYFGWGVIVAVAVGIGMSHEGMIPGLAGAAMILAAIGFSLAGAVAALLNCFFDRTRWGFHIGQATCFLLTVAGVLLLVKISQPMGRVKPRAVLISCGSNLKQIRMALEQYAADNDGFLPPENGAAGLEYLRCNSYLTDRLIYVCPLREPPTEGAPVTEEHCSYIFYGGGRFEPETHSLLLADKHGNHPEGAYNVLYSDGVLQQERGGL